ncbi:MAG TPA: transporter [Nitrospirae bacterium]|nr:transporter [Nitrospirota bacterium]
MRSKRKSISKQMAIAAAFTMSLLCLSASNLFAHGESIRGGIGSINAIGAAILEQRTMDLRWDGRRYTTFSNRKMADFKKNGEDVHQHKSEDSYFLSLGFPIFKNMDINLQLQYNDFKGFKDNGDDFANACFASAAPDFPSSCVSPTSDSPGLGDMLVTGRYRFYKTEKSQFASIFGVILPSGTITNRTDNGEIIGTHNQPGYGGVTFQGGLAYTGHISEGIALDTDLIYRFSTQGAKQFRTGNSTQFDLAISYGHHLKIVPVLEINAIFFDQDIENDKIKKNSGGDVVYISPGVKVNISHAQNVYANYSYPAYQKLGGISNDEKGRFSIGWGMAF